MSTQFHFKSNLRDIFFNLFECLNVGKVSLGQGPFQNMDEAGARDVIETFEKLCTNEFAKSYADSDRNPPTFGSDGNVKLPASVKESLKTFYEGDWHKLDHTEALQGFGAPQSVSWAVYELLYGANPILPFYTFGSTLARVINSVGTEKQKKLFVENMLERDWGGTMVLTEPDAGSVDRS